MSPRGLVTLCFALALTSVAQLSRMDARAQNIAVTVLPNTAEVAVNRSLQFTATVTNTDSTRVIWSVDGGSVNGAMTSAGRYTAPSLVPSPATVTIRATSAVDPSASGTATVTVRGLTLHAPDDVRVATKMNSDRRSFTNFIFWRAPFADAPAAEDLKFFVHPPDTAGWRTRSSTIPVELLSQPTSGGRYTGSIDRTVVFTATEGGAVGSGRPTRPSLRLRCQVDGGRETLMGEINIGGGYTAGTPVGVVFTGGVNLGFTVSFSPGLVDSNGIFKVGLEVFEGYHIFRGLCPVCGTESDMVNIGEVSYEDAFRRDLFDSLYFDAALPALRTFGVYTLPQAIAGLGSTIDIRDPKIHPNGRLGPDELIWVDNNAFNGFTYNYLVTTFDKGYNVLSTAQGLRKYDHCRVEKGVNLPCAQDLVTVTTKVDPLADFPQIYAVPNPYRDPAGTTKNTTANYHNFPDNKMRFVNVPTECDLKIYTPSGDLVWEHNRQDGDGSGVIEWDTRNQSGELVASGVYIYRVEGNPQSWMYGRLVIIR